MARLALVLALCASLSANAGEVAPAFAASLTGGALAVLRPTSRGQVGDPYSILTAHLELGAQLNSAGALVALGNLSLPLTQRPVGALVSAGAGLRFGPDALQITLGAALTAWSAYGTSATGPSLLLHLALPLASRLALQAQGEAHFLGTLTGYALTIGIGFAE